jgi:hypothetical protein
MICQLTDQSDTHTTEYIKQKKEITPLTHHCTPYSLKPIRHKKKGKKKIKLPKKQISLAANSHIPRHTSERIMKQKLAIHKSIGTSMKNAVQCLHRTKDPSCDRMHQMPVCIVCDCFIIGAEKIHRMAAKTIKKHANVLSSQSLEELSKHTITPGIKKTILCPRFAWIALVSPST